MALQTKIRIPSHPEGWDFAGSSGLLGGETFMVWKAGYMDYRITNTKGEVFATRRQLGEATAKASSLSAVSFAENFVGPVQY